MKKFFKFLLWLVGVVVLLAAVVLFIWRKEVATISSVKQVGDNPYLFEMQYKADYDLDDLVASDIDVNTKLIGYVVGRLTKGLPLPISTGSAGESAGAPSTGEDSAAEHCTSFQAKSADSDGWIYGRNYDFFKNPVLVTYSYPKNGYASIAISDMAHFGYSLDKVPQNFAGKALCIASIYAPMDGINEKGLCTSIMALPKQPSQLSTGKHVVGTSVIMRLFLDRCATVDEALALLETVDVRHDLKAGSGYHYMVADAQGNCAVIEFDLFDGWKYMITRKAEGKNEMVCTNHLLAEKYYTEEPDPVLGNPHSKSWWRYAQASAYLAERSGIVTPEEAQECLANVHWKDLVWDNGMVEDTQYSAVYDQKELSLRLRPWNDYETTSFFNLKK